MTDVTIAQAKAHFNRGGLVAFIDYKKGKIKKFSKERVAEISKEPLSAVLFDNVVKYGCADMSEINFRIL